MDNLNSTHHDTEQSNDAPLTPEEREQYKKLISEAYPQPKRTLSAEVLQQIRKETEQKERRRRLLNRMVQIGRIAACFLAVFGVLTAIVPFINRSTKDSAGEPVSAYYLCDNALNLTGLPAEADVQKAEDAAKDIIEEVPNCTNSEHEADEDLQFHDSKSHTYSLSDDSLIALCTAHDLSYHTFSDELQTYIGKEALTQWLDSENAVDECGIPSVRTLVRDFGITREQFEKITKTGSVTYDLDSIYAAEQ